MTERRNDNAQTVRDRLTTLEETLRRQSVRVYELEDRIKALEEKLSERGSSIPTSDQEEVERDV